MAKNIEKMKKKITRSSSAKVPLNSFLGLIYRVPGTITNLDAIQENKKKEYLYTA